MVKTLRVEQVHFDNWSLFYLVASTVWHLQFLRSPTTSQINLLFIQVTLSEGQPRDLLDALLMGQMDCKHLQKSNESEDERITDDHVLMTAAETFGAGVETTSTTLLWILAYLLHHPEVKVLLFFCVKLQWCLQNDLHNACMVCVPRTSRFRSASRRSWMSKWAVNDQLACRTEAGCHTWTASSTRACGSDQSARC